LWSGGLPQSGLRSGRRRCSAAAGELGTSCGSSGACPVRASRRRRASTLPSCARIAARCRSFHRRRPPSTRRSSTARSRRTRGSTGSCREASSAVPRASLASTRTLWHETSTHASGLGSTRRSDLPRAAREQRQLVATARHAADRDFVRADHEVDVDVAHVDPRQVRRIGDRARVGVSERDVAR